MKTLKARRRGRPTEYPWKLWTNGEVHTVHRKQNYSCKTVSFVDSLRKYGRRLKRYVSIRQDGDTVRFQYERPVRAKRAAKGGAK